MTNQDTICAIATAQGGALGIIRLSGPEAISATRNVFAPSGGEKELKANTQTFGRIYNGEEMLDEVLVSIYRAPHSYTGEDSTEITCHGSVYILQQIMRLLIRKGCRLARPGEFTQRAFLNGKMDLSQAEAVADLIASTSEATHRLAMNQMRGGFSRQLTELRGHLLNFTSLIELELDFSEEDVEFADRKELLALADHIENVITGLADSFDVGNAIKNGVPVAIAGETNAGKSTLLNVLLNEERAIVSEIHGTTRDTIEDTIGIGGITFRFIDTAGIRETSDEIESLGIERTFRKIEQAEIVLWIIDSKHAEAQLGKLSGKILSLTSQKQLLLVFNKSELIDSEARDRIINLTQPLHKGRTHTLFISAKQRSGIDELRSLLIEAAHIPHVSPNDIIVTNVRHYEALSHAREAIRRVQQGLRAHISGDFLAQDIRECIFHLSDIVGEVTTDQVLGNIFEKFCIGK